MPKAMTVLDHRNDGHLGLPVATPSRAGYMSAADKTALDALVSASAGTTDLSGYATLAELQQHIATQHGAVRDIGSLPGMLDHTALTSIGANTHAQIDSHIGSTANPHATSDANLSTSDVTTNNASAAKHGFLPKLSGVAAQFLDGSGAWSTPAGVGDVVGPAGAVADNFAAFDGVTGKLIKDSGSAAASFAAAAHTHSHTALTDIGANAHSVIDTHLGSTSNPHGVTKTQVGIGNVIDSLQAVAGAVGSSGLTMATAKVLGRATAGTGAIEELPTTGTGDVVLATSPTLTTPTVAGGALTFNAATAVTLPSIAEALNIGSNMLVFDTVTGDVGIGTATPGAVGAQSLAVFNWNATPNNIQGTLGLQRGCTQTAQAGLGAALDFQVQDDAGNIQQAANIAGILTAVTAGAVSSAISLRTRLASAAYAEVMRLTARQNVLIGTSAEPGTGTKALVFGDGTAPASMGGNTAGLYANDVAGIVELFGIDEAGNAPQLTPHDPLTGEWYFSSTNIYSGRVLRCDLERLVREVERLTGKRFLAENWLPQEALASWDDIPVEYDEAGQARPKKPLPQYVHKQRQSRGLEG